MYYRQNASKVGNKNLHNEHLLLKFPKDLFEIVV